MENLVRLRILSMNVFSFIFFAWSNSNSTISDLKHHLQTFKFLGNEDSDTVDNVIASTCRSCVLSIYTVN